jgi:hypothetical protein
MREYLPTRGRLGHEMMKRTATVQANLDFSSEEDAVEKIRLAFGITSVVTAMFAASPITAGKPNGWKSYRAAVWLDMDEDRSGLLPFAFEPGFRFGHYVEWALDVPMFFVVRDGVYHPVGGMTFRRFLEEGWQGQRATRHDWEVHLSTLFPRGTAQALHRGARRRLGTAARGPGPGRPVARTPRRHRGAGRRHGPWSRRGPTSSACACGARCRPPASAPAWATSPWPRWPSSWCRSRGRAWAACPRAPSDQPLLDPLLDYARAGRCPADDMLDDFAAANGDPRKLVAAWQFKV